MSNFIPPGLGWQPDLPDLRDFTPETKKVRKLLSRLEKGKRKTLPNRVDLRQNGGELYFSEVDDQQGLNCCCACAAVAMIEYFERRAHGRVFDGSKLYLHQTSRCLSGIPVEINGHSKDAPFRSSGIAVSLRTTLKTLTRFGLPPEELWPFRPEIFHTDPANLCLTGYAREYRRLRYFRLDAGSGKQTLATIKSYLAAGFPVAFGVPVLRSVTMSPDIPYRPTFDSARGGQAVVAVGYDDTYPGPTRGALNIRNSWGSAWGAGGYGWLPYAYVKRQLARDFWTLLRADWVAAGEFSLPHSLE